MPPNFDQDIWAVSSVKALPTILDIICRVTGMRFAAVARVTEDRWVACSIKDEIDFGLKPGGELKLESTLCHEVRQGSEAIVIDHADEDEKYRNHHTPRAYKIQSYISVPIRLANGAFFGTLCAIDPLPRKIKTQEITSMFEMFADVIGRHIDSVQHLNSTKELLLNEQNTAALREQFIAVLGHDLRNPLGAIKSGLRLLGKTPLDDKAVKIISLMGKSVIRMADLIENVMDFARGRLGGGLSLNVATEVSVEPLMREIVAELQSQHADRKIETFYALATTFDCDKIRIGQLLSNLLSNALAYGAAEHPIIVRATADDSVFELAVMNAGDPIPAEIRESIFKPFARGAVRPKLEGLGLGLYISYEIAKAHGGTLSAASDTGGTCFTFKMPAKRAKPLSKSSTLLAAAPD